MNHQNKGEKMENKFKVGQWVLIPLDTESSYKITKIYEDENFSPVVDLDDGDNYKIVGKSIYGIHPIPKRKK